MPGLNTTGAPNTRDYNLGRGIVRLAELDATTGLPNANGFRDLGNAPEFNITVSTEDLRHQSSRTQIKFTDKRCTISQEVGLSFILDELNFQNIADFFAGTTEIYNNPHDTTWAATASIVSTSIVLGNWYQLYSDTGARVYDLGEASLVYDVVEDPAGTPTSLAADDYEIDEEMGLIRFVGTGTNSLAGGETIGFAVTTGAGTAQDLDQVNALTRGDVVGALLFVATNACDQGNKTEYLFHRASLAADGDLGLISDEIGQLSFTGVAEVNSFVTDPSQVLTIRSYDQLA